MYVKDGYSKGETGRNYRTPANVAELIAWCGSHSHITFLAVNGMARTAKVNGKVRTWKRDPNRIEIPLKYGMYEYTIFTASDIGRVLIPIHSRVLPI